MDKSGKVWRVVAIIFMGLTAAMNLLGGAGTTCAAFSNNVGYRMAFKDLMDYRWLYQGLVVTTILIGLLGIWATVRLVRGGPSVYKFALYVLIIGTVLGGIQFTASMVLRGKATPANVKFYVNAITLLYFLLLSAPGIRDKVNFSAKGNDSSEKTTAGGMAAILAGTVILTVFSWAGPSHTFYGENWVYVFFTPLVVIGTVLILGGIAAHLWVARGELQQDITQPGFEFSE